MKKFVMFCAAFLAVASVASAQTVKESKIYDNWFLGIDGGAFIKTSHSKYVKDARAMFGIKAGRYLTPVFGLRGDVQAYTNCTNSPTAIDMAIGTLDGLFNFNNLFSGYKGEPRPFEVVGVVGIGAAHTFGSGYKTTKGIGKLGLQLNYNFGNSKEWAINLEPDIVYWSQSGEGYRQMNLNRSLVQVTAGLTYKFGTSNGTHNFVIVKPYDQNEIDALNAKINDQRQALGQKDNTINTDQNTIDELQKKLAECEATPKTVAPVKKTEVNLAPVVIFDQGKAIINPNQGPSVKMIATYMKNHPNAKVTIKGYASPEGNKEINQKLSLSRANAVKNMLVKKYKVSAKRLTVVGLGATNEVFDENDWNRVCTFVEK